MSEEKQALIAEMETHGLHYGHNRTNNHPRAGYFTLKSNAELSLINLEETVKGMEAALDFLVKTKTGNGTVLFVGTIPGAKKGVESLAKKYDSPYVVNRWLGGTLTNFKTLHDRIGYWKDLEQKKKSGDWQKYTKHERAQREDEMVKLGEKFAGLKDMADLPNVLFVIDPKIHETAVREAQKMNIPVVAVLDTDDDPEDIDYPIPANDSAKSSIEFILSQVEASLKKAGKNK